MWKAACLLVLLFLSITTGAFGAQALIQKQAEFLGDTFPVEGLLQSAEPARHLLGPESVTCLGDGEDQICCKNCTSCCKATDHMGCNLGAGNRGWGNMGNDNFGDFNFANNSKGDCNIEDDCFGIGGPEYKGCPEETWEHILRFCSIFPYYHKCHSPPVYFGDTLTDLLRETVLKCDKNIPVKPKHKAPAKESSSGRRQSRSHLHKVRIPRAAGRRK